MNLSESVSSKLPSIKSSLNTNSVAQLNVSRLRNKEKAKRNRMMENKSATKKYQGRDNLL